MADERFDEYLAEYRAEVRAGADASGLLCDLACYASERQWRRFEGLQEWLHGEREAKNAG